LGPVEKKYELLNRHGVKGLSKEERDELKNLRKSWKAMKDFSDEVADGLGRRQGSLRGTLMRDVQSFKEQAFEFSEEFERNGPGVEGISPEEAIDRLREQEREVEIIDRKLAQLNAGEALFGLPRTDVDALNQTRKAMKLYKQLYDLYETVEASSRRRVQES